ncbi:neprilysin-1-like [Drosophila takahashii]|uniref:neprilysin-1-like n=1 Tax=Drosophila takahashii TaxID=29030 RepID=UPI001CF83980|nr:endothelin-converting enzyme 1-like [Drosophila takahashii]
MELFQKNLVRLLIFVIILIFPSSGDKNATTNHKRNNLESYANLMKSYMNLDVDPCRDFYEYACGNYRDHNELLESMLDFWTLNYNSEQLEGQIEHLLGRMDLAESLNVSSELRVAQRFYNACLKADLHPFPATDPHYLTLIRSIGGFPAVDGANWNASNFSWFNMSSHLINYGAEGLFRDEISSSFPFQPNLGYERLGFEEFDNSRPNHEERMAGYLRAFQLPEDKISEVIAGVFAFWEDARSSHAQPSGNCKLFEANYFEIVWDGDKIVWNKDQPRKDEDCSSYVVKLDKVCARHPEAVANYLAMKLLRALDATLHSTEEQKQHCLGQVKFSMRFLFSKLLLAEKFPEKKKSGVSEIVEEVWNTLSSSLDEADRLNNFHKSRRVLWEFPFSFPKVNSYADRVISEIGRLEIVDGSYAATNINLHRLAVNSSRYSARHSMDLPMSSKSADHMLNEFSRFERFLRPPFYHHSWPLALRFGAFGSVVARQAYVNLKSYEERLDIRLEENKLRLAFSAYKNHIKHLQEDHKQDKINETMPGIDLSPDQLFFLGATQIFCDRSKKSKDRADYSIKYNQEFPQVFNCSAGYGG